MRIGGRIALRARQEEPFEPVGPSELTRKEEVRGRTQRSETARTKSLGEQRVVGEVTDFVERRARHLARISARHHRGDAIARVRRNRIRAFVYDALAG